MLLGGPLTAQGWYPRYHAARRSARLPGIPGTAVTIVSIIAAGGFALTGAELSDYRARRRDATRFNTETALELSVLERAIWQESWIELRVLLEQQRARLAVANVPSDLLDALEATTLACWQDVRRSMEIHDEPGIGGRLLNGQRSVLRAIRADLTMNNDRDRLRAAAIQEVTDAGVELPGESRP